MRNAEAKIALIAHDEKKAAIVEFVGRHVEEKTEVSRLPL
jgi:methylglyoxal synthase